MDRTVSVGGDPEILLSRIVYGELLASPADTNHRGRVYRAYDGAGVATSLAFDFKGQALEEQRQLYGDKTTQPDWSDLLGEDTIAEMASAAASLLDAETFSASSESDALGHVLTAISPDGSAVHYVYDEGGALRQVTLNHRGSETEQTVVGDITYDAKGRREAVVYGPTSTTSYTYDALSQRLTRLRTVRASDSEAIQSLHYHYDPVGNITDIRDTAQQTVYFDNTVVTAANSYTYDALYRLVEATGREHSSEGVAQRTHADMSSTAQPMASDPSAMRLYTQQFVYDAVGNILEMKHLPSSGTGWTRYYQYDELGNRLEATSASGDDPEGPYTHEYPYDEHGNMVEMPHLSAMIWNHDDELREVTAGSETVYFQYGGGNRSRKFTEKSGTTTEERIYLGNFEIYRKRISGDIEVERESLHVSDGTGRILLIETKTIDEGDAVTTPVGIWRYQLSNHIGSASTEITEAGEMISYEYHPYGTTAYQAVDSSLEVSAKRYRYTGMERGEETGLGYHTARYYASWLGRWTASDPIALKGGGNRYGYCGGGPTTTRDLAGTIEWGNIEAPKTRAEAENLLANLRQLERTTRDPADRAQIDSFARQAEAYIQQGDAAVARANARTEPSDQAEIPLAARLGKSDLESQQMYGSGICREPRVPPVPVAPPPPDGPSMSVNRGDSVPDFRQTERGRRDAALLHFAQHGIAGLIRLGLGAVRDVSGVDVSDETLNVLAATGGLALEARGGSMGASVAGGGVMPEVVHVPGPSSLNPPLIPSPRSGTIIPEGGVINAGGGFETPHFSNLNPIRGTSGPQSGIPNHIRGSFEEIGEIYAPGSARLIMSSKLQAHMVDWKAAAPGAYQTLRPGGEVSLNIWAQEGEAATAAEALTNAGFTEVKISGDGVGTMLTARKPNH